MRTCSSMEIVYFLVWPSFSLSRSLPCRVQAAWISLDIRSYVPIFWHLESMTSSLASGSFSDCLSSSWPSVRESRISPKGPCPCFLWGGDLYPGLVCLLNVLQAPVLCLRRILEKRKEFGLKWDFVLISLVYLRPWGTSWLSTTEDISRVSAHKERRVTLT